MNYNTITEIDEKSIRAGHGRLWIRIEETQRYEFQWTAEAEAEVREQIKSVNGDDEEFDSMSWTTKYLIYFMRHRDDEDIVEFLGDDTYYREMTDRVHEIVREREFEEKFEDY